MSYLSKAKANWTESQWYKSLLVNGTLEIMVREKRNKGNNISDLLVGLICDILESQTGLSCTVFYS
jgi:hypothetical protein